MYRFGWKFFDFGGRLNFLQRSVEWRIAHGKEKATNRFNSLGESDLFITRDRTLFLYLTSQAKESNHTSVIKDEL